jgi:hypothetical protein
MEFTKNLSVYLTGAGDQLYWQRPRRQLTSVGLETHRTADLEVGATNLPIGS